MQGCQTSTYTRAWEALTEEGGAAAVGTRRQRARVAHHLAGRHTVPHDGGPQFLENGAGRPHGVPPAGPWEALQRVVAAWAGRANAAWGRGEGGGML